MKVLRSTTAFMFVVCAVLSVLFGIELVLITGEVVAFHGMTDLVGKVEDQNGNPLANVSVISGNSKTVTDQHGVFQIEGIGEGKVEIRLYKDGYVGLRTGLIAYPDQKRWIGDGSGDVNDLSEDPFILYTEMEWMNVSGANKVTIAHLKDGEGNSTLEINLLGNSVKGRILLEVLDDDAIVAKKEVKSPEIGKVIIVLPEGTYNLTMAGEEVLDQGFTGVEVKGWTTRINITVEEQSFFEYGLDQDVEGNYFLAFIYILIGVGCAVGAFIAYRTDRWNLLLMIGILSFFGRGPIDILEVNLMSLFSTISIFLVIMLRKDMLRGRRSFRPRPSAKT